MNWEVQPCHSDIKRCLEKNRQSIFHQIFERKIVNRGGFFEAWRLKHRWSESLETWEKPHEELKENSIEIVEKHHEPCHRHFIYVDSSMTIKKTPKLVGLRVVDNSPLFRHFTFCFSLSCLLFSSPKAHSAQLNWIDASLRKETKRSPYLKLI